MSDQTPTTPTKKPWYKSKITLLGGAVFLITGGNLLTGFITGQGVTPEQLDAIKVAYPAIADAVKQLQSGADFFTVIGPVVGAALVVFRVWFTNTTVTLK